MRLASLALCAALLPGVASANAAFDRLVELLGVDAYIAVTRNEGLRGVDDLALDMTGRPASPSMVQQMDQIYNAERMRDTVVTWLETELTEEQITTSLIVFDSAPGMRITELEIAARQAISDKDIETAARLAWIGAEETHPWLVARINEMVSINDLIERNVSGALNSNFRFFQGLADGDGLEMSESEMLADVWSQEEEVRIDTAAWIGGYLLLAYQPLSEEDLADYLAFWKTDTGRALNGVLFDSFNKMYDDISYATGRVVALNLSGQDL